MATTADFRNGLCIEFNGELYFIIEFQHVKPGKGPAFVRTKLKSVKNGRVIDNTFSSGHKVTTARIERRPHQYLYQDGMGFHFMNGETFEEIIVDPKFINEPGFLKDGMEVEVIVHAEAEQIMGVDLPQFVILEVTYSEPGIKGDTATNTLKPATLEGGIQLNVPLFVNQGDLIKVDTREYAYVERVKK